MKKTCKKCGFTALIYNPKRKECPKCGTPFSIKKDIRRGR